MRYFAVNNTLENAFTALDVGDSDSDDMLTPVGPFGRASRRHRLRNPCPTERLREAVHFDTPNPSGKALMYNDSDSQEEGYPPESSTGYPRGGSVIAINNIALFLCGPYPWETFNGPKCYT